MLTKEIKRIWKKYKFMDAKEESKKTIDSIERV